jgi:hypothetical protein
MVLEIIDRIKQFFIMLKVILLLIAACVVSGCLEGCSCTKSSYHCYRFPFPDIEESIFLEYPKLTQITLIGSKLTTLPVGLFAGLSELQELKMPNNAFESLPAGIFAGLERLSRVSLSYNSLNSLPEGLFRDATHLHTLNLDNNKLASFPADLLSYTPSLEFLDASENQLAGLPPSLFLGLKALQSASFAQNKIPALAPRALRDLASLKSLNLASNRIASLSLGLFIDTPKLYSLYLYQNQLCSYGAAASSEAIISVIIDEVKHHVDVIVQPQSVLCPLPVKEEVHASAEKPTAASDLSQSDQAPYDLNFSASTMTSSCFLPILLIIFVLVHVFLVFLCYHGISAVRRNKTLESMV